ncbi:hypothetical protein niasHT_038503 [Heterodera trifolii]|uniref:FHA domain-containing protein n=1 Tax=Heterodera trifolii TaxID=157864 RepID=A0ABD2ITJ3_9BILA
MASVAVLLRSPRSLLLVLSLLFLHNFCCSDANTNGSTTRPPSKPSSSAVPTTNAPPNGATPAPNGGSGDQKMLIYGLIGWAVFATLAALVLLYCACCRKPPEKEEDPTTTTTGKEADVEAPAPKEDADPTASIDDEKKAGGKAPAKKVDAKDKKASAKKSKSKSSSGKKKAPSLKKANLKDKSAPMAVPPTSMWSVRQGDQPDSGGGDSVPKTTAAGGASAEGGSDASNPAGGSQNYGIRADEDRRERNRGRERWEQHHHHRHEHHHEHRRKSGRRGEGEPPPGGWDKPKWEDDAVKKEEGGGEEAEKQQQRTGEEEKEKPSFVPSGKLAKDTNTYKGVLIKRQNFPNSAGAYIRLRVTILCRCSKQPAALQYRSLAYERSDGSTGRRTRPYVIDLGSGNGTFLNGDRIEAQRYYELREKDVLRFGFSSREYVLLHEHSAAVGADDEAEEDTSADEGEEEDEVMDGLVDRTGGEERIAAAEEDDLF